MGRWEQWELQNPDAFLKVSENHCFREKEISGVGLLMLSSFKLSVSTLKILSETVLEQKPDACNPGIQASVLGTSES